MIASRLWYIVLGVALGFAVFVLFLGASMFDRQSKRQMSEGLAGDAQVVGWYLRDDARKRSAALVNFALDSELVGVLSKASGSHDKLPLDVREKTKKLLKTVDEKLPADLKFTSLFAVDQYGRVVGQFGFDQASGIEDFELGGYPIVADALHGWVRDDSWVLDGRIYRIVARPVEGDTSQPPAGAIVGARIVDDSFAKDLSKRTNAAVAFFAAGTRVAAAAPEGFDAAQLDSITSDLGSVLADPNYREKGRSEVRILQGNLGVVYSLVPGESWELGAGYAVGRAASLVGSPMGFLQKSDDNDKKSANLPLIGGLAGLAALLGLLFSFFEHTKPMNTFAREATKLAKGEVDTLAPSKFFGAYRKIASDINDGIDKIAAKGGAPRKAADLQQVLGPIPAQPAMSAFSIPDTSKLPEASAQFNLAPELSGSFNVPGSGPKPPTPRREQSGQIKLPRPSVDEPEATVVSQIPQDLLAKSAALESASGLPVANDEMGEWPKVFEEFVRVKKENGEPTDGLTFEKFKTTLQKNRDALVARHGCKRVKFTVYVKEGKAALKASPVKD